MSREQKIRMIMFFLLGCFSMLISRSQTVHVQYDVVFNNLFDRPVAQFRSLNAHLFISDSGSVFFMNPAYEAKDTDSELDVQQDTVWRILTKAGVTELLFEDIINAESGSLWYKDSLFAMQWELGTDQKYVDSLLCQKATCRFRGRDYIAWFSEKYPYPYGPWKFGGLPGLIVELEDVKQDLQFMLSSIKQAPYTGVSWVTTAYSFPQYVQKIEAFRKVLEESSAVSDCLTCDSKGKLYSWEKDITIQP